MSAIGRNPKRNVTSKKGIRPRDATHNPDRSRLAAAVLLALCSACQPSVVDLDGRRIDPLERDAVATVLLFVGEQCPISNRYAPEIQRIYKTYRTHDVRMYLVYADPKSTAASARRHESDYDLDVPALLDPKHELMIKTGVQQTPEVAVFDARGDLVYRGRIDNRFVTYTKPRARVTRHELRDTLDTLIAGRPMSVKTTTVAGCHIPPI